MRKNNNNNRGQCTDIVRAFYPGGLEVGGGALKALKALREERGREGDRGQGWREKRRVGERVRERERRRPGANIESC